MEIRTVSNQTNLFGVTSSVNEALEVLSTCELLQVDTETIGNYMDGYIYTLQLGDGNVAFVVDCTTIDILLFKNLLETKTLLLQNAKYDLKWFYNHNIRPTQIIDTLLAECVLTCGIKDRKLGLDALAMKYCGVTLDKTIRGKINYLGLTKEVIEYAAGDVMYLEKIWKHQKLLLEQKHLMKVAQLEFDACLLFAEMEWNGIRLNREKWMENVIQTSLLLEGKLEELNSYLLKSSYKVQVQFGLFEQDKLFFNWNSPLQVKHVFEHILNRPFNSVSEKEIERIVHPLIKMYLEFKDLQTQLSKYGKNFLNWIKKDGKVHTDYWQIVNSGRVSSGNDEAPNMQNIPKEDKFRECFESDEGKSFIIADYSSQELIIIAEDSKEKVFIDAINNGWDLHSFVAEIVFGDKWLDAAEFGCDYIKTKSKCSCKEHKKMRNSVKTLNYALSYGAGAAKLANSLNVSIDEAKRFINSYFKAMPSLKKYFDKSQSFGVNNGYSITFPPFNRKRYYAVTSETEAQIKRQSANSRIQGTGADMLKLAMINLDKVRKKLHYKVEFVLQVHDEIICQVEDQFAENWKKIMIDVMVETSKVFLTQLEVPVDAKVSKKWEK